MNRKQWVNICTIMGWARSPQTSRINVYIALSWACSSFKKAEVSHTGQKQDTNLCKWAYKAITLRQGSWCEAVCITWWLCRILHCEMQARFQKGRKRPSPSNLCLLEEEPNNSQDSWDSLYRSMSPSLLSGYQSWQWGHERGARSGLHLLDTPSKQLTLKPPLPWPTCHAPSLSSYSLKVSHRYD